MAEVKINISAGDGFTPVIRAIAENARGVVGGMNAFMQGEAQAFQASRQSVGECAITSRGAQKSVCVSQGEGIV